MKSLINNRKEKSWNTERSLDKKYIDVLEEDNKIISVMTVGQNIK